ncbi:uncharacterized protein LOC122060772 [Macadamia integrifolia]|uniref:uncharacterized protein LOC122060772 n=1 Tax=Macadamia integrifolia TaxID=60698 RepID=UPI001C5303E8|nr:uncharacterized protein LOC122060772 [Macadamia integrifolia]
MESYMSSRLYKAAASGDVDYLLSETVSEERKERLKRDLLSRTHEESYCLHVASRFVLPAKNKKAVRFGHEEFVRSVVNLFPSLLYQQNLRGDNPLHVASRAGHLDIVKILIDSFQQLQHPQSTERAGDDIIIERSLREAEEGERHSIQLPLSSHSESSSTGNVVIVVTSSEWASPPIGRTQNNDGSTALHEALRSKHEEVALHLLDLDKELVAGLVVNAKDESPLYLAAEACFVGVLKKSLAQAGGVTLLVRWVRPPYMLQFSLKAKVLWLMLNELALHENARVHGSFTQFCSRTHQKTRFIWKNSSILCSTVKLYQHNFLLLELDASSVYICDNKGLSPLLAAASNHNCSKAVRAILDACPASIASSDDNGHNALHLAVKYNYPDTFEDLWRMPEIKALIKEPDHQGKRTTASSNHGMGPSPLFYKTEILWKLEGRKASMGRVRPLMSIPYWDPNSNSTTVEEDAELVQMANTQAVVAALFVTITFAAAFTIPGGFKADGSGTPSLVHKPALIIFCLSDAIGMSFSMAALAVLLNATVFGQKAFSKTTILYSMFLLFFAVYASMIAFISGFYAMISMESTNQSMASYMSSRLYKAAAAGDAGYLSSETVSEERKERLKRDLLCLTHEGSNCLHIAARFGRVKILQFQCEMFVPYSFCPCLLYQRNKRGDNPLHVAARAGDLCLVKLFTHSFLQHQPPQNSQSTESAGNRAIAGEGNQENSTNLTDSVQRLLIAQSQSMGDNMILQRSLREAVEGERPSRPIIWGSTQNQDSIQPHPPSSQSGSTSEWPSMPIWRTQNQDGSTALHEALRSKHEDVALHLLDLDSELVVGVINAKDESPLYLAAEAGFVSVLKKILGAGGRNNTVGPMGLTPLHAAVFSQSADCIKALHNSIPELNRKKDQFGKTALYYATQEKYIRIMRLLLKLDASSAYICDNEGRSPLLAAASMGNCSTVEAILEVCPDLIESSDDSGHNALHLAVKYNSTKRLESFLELPGMITLINEPDHEGNTPLHLATMARHYHMIPALSRTNYVDLTAKNNDGKTALDLYILDPRPASTLYDKGLTSSHLRKANVSRGRVRPLMRVSVGDQSIDEAQNKNLREFANTLAVVEALLVTVTFMAVFQVPGGYKTNGSPALIHNAALIIFFLSDLIALGFSSMALIFVIPAMSNDMPIARSSIVNSVYLLNAALSACVIVCISGFYAVLKIESTWMAILACVMCCAFYLLFQMALDFVQTNVSWVPVDKEAPHGSK